MLFFFFTSTASGQAILLYQKDGAAFDQFGWSVAGAGDVNGDGKADFIVGAPNASPGGLSSAGSAYIYSGATGLLLFRKKGAAAGDHFGYSVAGAGDVDGDGKADFIVGAYWADPGGRNNAGSAYLYSGADGSLLFQKDGAVGGFPIGDQLGNSVAGAGDVNGDGKADFIVGAYSARGDKGSAYLYSGADGLLLFQKDGAALEVFGKSVAGAGDADGDGKTDFIVGAYWADPDGRLDAGSAYLYSGATGALLYQKNGAAAGNRLGKSVASAGDVNGDGRADFIIGAFWADPGGRNAAGSAYLYSGATGALLFQKDGTAAGDQLGISVAGAGEVDGDGRADFIVGAYLADPSGRFNAGSACLYSGATGALIFQKDGTAAGDQLGISVAGAGDVNGDGKADFIVGAPNADLGGIVDAGSAYVYAGSSCAAAKGDMNADASFTVSDVVLLLNCTFWGSGSCNLCFADVNCDGVLTSSDVVLELNRVFLGLTAPPWCGT